jgi:uncharacterized repeat protein (TIGR02543 family)
MKHALLFIKKYMPNLLMHKIGKISFLLAFVLMMGGMNGVKGQISKWSMTSNGTTWMASPLNPNYTASNATVSVALTRGSGIGAAGTSADYSFGGSGANQTTSANAITNNNFFTVALKANSGYTMSLTGIPTWYTRKSGTGTMSVLVQYSLNSGSYTDIGTISITSTSSGGSNTPLTFSTGVQSALSNLPNSTTVTFRFVVISSTSANIYLITGNSTNNTDRLIIDGTISNATPSNSTVTFDANGGTGTMSNQSASSSTALTSNSFSRTGYTFAGWNTAANGTGTAYADGASYPFTSSTTLYAQWTANNYTVTFDANGGTGNMANQTSSSAANLTANAYTRTGYTFTGWNTAANGTGTAYADGASYPFTSSTTLYAQWAANNTASAASSSPTLCINTALTNITHATTGATGIGTATGLPAGVTAAFAANTITISGTPTASGTFNYSIPLTGGYGSVNATGTITVTALPSAPTAIATQILCPGATVSNLSATGTAIQWYAASSGGSALSSGTSLGNNTNYYATQTVNGCESATRTTVTTSFKNQWTGANSSSWSNNGNWSCGAVPSATDNILIAPNSSNPTILDADFTVSASGTLTISGSGTLTINPGQKLILTGNANFGGNLVTVATNASGTSGAIVLNGGALTGASNVSLQQYFTGQRAWRMLSNPFTTAITAAAISTNNTSLSVNQSGTGDMVVYNSSNDSWSANNSISANSCYGFFYKGLQSDFNGTPGLSNYSGSGPTATTFTVNGTLNTGAVSITPNASSVFTLVGNPFAAPVNSIALTGGSAAPYYYYQASSASTDIKVKSGAWIAAVSNSSSSTTIPMMGMIAYQAASNAPFSINTSDINTTNTSLSNLYKTTSSSNQMVLELHRNNSLFDRLILREDPFANVNKVDANDLVKKDNAIANVYAISPSNHHLALHTEPEFTQAIPLGITAPIGSYQFKFNATWNQCDWYLIDNYMHQQILLSATSPYNFDINSDLTSYGEKRFELLKKTWTTQVENTQLSETIRLQTNLVQQEIRFASTQATVNLHYQLKDMNGAVVKSGILQDLNQAINVEQLASGFYIVQLADARQQVSFKIVKQ